MFENHVKQNDEKEIGLKASLWGKEQWIGLYIQLKLEPILLKLLFYISKKVCCCKMCNCNKAMKWKTFAAAILKKLLHVGSTIINIAVQLA